jgi:hypothetical protein
MYPLLVQCRFHVCGASPTVLPAEREPSSKSALPNLSSLSGSLGLDFYDGQALLEFLNVPRGDAVNEAILAFSVFLIV